MDDAEYVRQVMTPLEPVATGVAPKLPRLAEIEVVVFDLYGTLIISAAGDISLAGDEVSLPAMKIALGSVEQLGTQQNPENWVKAYQEVLLEQKEEARSSGVQFPEIEIRAVWRELARRSGAGDLAAEELSGMALRYECGINPCWGMPGAKQVVRELDRRGYLLGIVSNAQFYTHAVVEGLLDLPTQEEPFAPDLTVFSYQEREGKPSLRLFELLRTAVERKGVKPEKVFYVGNDLGKDVVPAAKMGFRTGLFAGDARSLRTGHDGIELACEMADAVLTDLRQVGFVLGIPV